MRKPLAAALLVLAAAGTGTAPAYAEPGAVGLAGTVALSNCSGSLVRFPHSVDTDPALVLSNGHCSSLFAPGVVVTDLPNSRTFGLLDSSGTQVATLKAERLVYATMTDTDVAFYRLTSTYAAIRDSYGISPLTVRDTRPAAGTPVTVASGAWKKLFDCEIDGFAHLLKEGEWTWKDAVRYSPACQTAGGTSGSPVLDRATGEVVAVHNTGNENGAACTRDNPCEVDPDGTVTVRKGINYGQQTYRLPACFTTGGRLDLTAPGCVLPRP
ncbi:MULTISPECIES: serine protease [unclassified Streptomyces]|uniref:trypsin-like serine peptidase n=1 Tax=unclassified Streptomyces TaxID=2593676 RepID=UPI000DD94318|nr:MULTISPECIES: serine protease [unclassified Streptomyces]QZZ26326.1 trypsin-like peptidase domain-containing protein [Streptomyces sp. ST1015]